MKSKAVPEEIEFVAEEDINFPTVEELSALATKYMRSLKGDGGRPTSPEPLQFYIPNAATQVCRVCQKPRRIFHTSGVCLSCSREAS
jgi:hypothetical protein